MDAPLQIPLPFAYDGVERRRSPRGERQRPDRRLPEPATEQDHPEQFYPEPSELQQQSAG